MEKEEDIWKSEIRKNTSAKGLKLCNRAKEGFCA